MFNRKDEYPAAFARAVTESFRLRADDVVFVHDKEGEFTGAALAQEVDDVARRLPGRGAVVLQTGKTPQFVTTLLACWLTGHTVVPMSHTYDAGYVADRLAGCVGGPVHRVTAAGLDQLDVAGGPEPQGGYLIPTGGSEGNPRLVETPAGHVERSLDGLAAIAATTGWRTGQRQLVCGPLDHAASFRFLLLGLRDRAVISLSEHFDPESVAAALHRIEWTHLTPAQMRAIAETGAFRNENTFRELRGMLHTSARCPRKLKRTWLDVVGPHRVHELYSFTEMIGATVISGVDWVRKPGSVGRGFATRLRVLDESPVVIEDDAFIGSRAMITNGARVGAGAVLGSGVILNDSIPVIDAETGAEISRGVVPPWTVAVFATRPREFPGGTFGMPSVLVIKRLEEGARHDKAAINDVLRTHGVAL